MRRKEAIWRDWFAEVLCDDGEQLDLHFRAADGDDLIAVAIQEAKERGWIPVSVESLEYEA